MKSSGALSPVLSGRVIVSINGDFSDEEIDLMDGGVLGGEGIPSGREHRTGLSSPPSSNPKPDDKSMGGIDGMEKSSESAGVLSPAS